MLVYDADSDVTIGFGTSSVWVYDANTNMATLREMPPEYAETTPGLGAVYDPVSGLVVLQTDTSGLVAYDADSDMWTPLGKVVDDGGDEPHVGSYGPYLVGYAQETDRLVLVDLSQQTGEGKQSGKGWLVDPRTGDSVAFTGPEDGFFAGFGRLNYATGTSSPFVVDDNRICRLHPTIPKWDCLAALADGPGEFNDDGSGSGLLTAIVDDPTNNRTLLIYGYGPGFDGARYYDVNDIWAIDHEDAHWTHLLPATGPVTFEND